MCEINEDCIKYAWHNILYIDDLYLTGRRLYLKQTLQVIVLMFLEGNLKCMWPKLKIHPHNLHITMPQKRKKKKKKQSQRDAKWFFLLYKSG